jgi:hypothetical protein
VATSYPGSGSCAPSCKPAALLPDPQACAWGAGRATCEVFKPLDKTAHYGEAYCFCQAGYRADGVPPTDLYRMEWTTNLGDQTHRVVVRPGQTCSTLCSDIWCSEVPIKNECR